MKRRQRSMISRYHRRPVSHKLEIRGLSRSRLDKHPLPEEADDHQSPRHDLHDLQEPGSIHDSSETSAASGHSDCPTIVSVDSSRSWSGIRSSTGTGLSTERSSVFSWGYDEFDQAASRQVQQMFEEIDKELYEGRGAGAGILQGLQEECQQWATRFPHLRVVGTQVVRPGDEGFQWFATPGRSSLESSPSTARGGGVGSPPRDPGSREWVPAGRIQTALTAFWLLRLWQSGRAPHPGWCVICVPFHVSFARVESLNVQGRRAALLQSSSARSDGLPGASSGSGSQHQQRVIEVEGLMEEYLAFDSRDPDDGCERDHSDSGDWRRCLPPVSPSRCRRQAVLDLLFDGVWQQLVGWMKELVQHRWECCTFGTPPGPPVNNNPAAEPCVWSAAGDKASGSLNPVQEDSQDPLLLSLEPATVAKVGHSRVPPIAAGHHAQNTKSGGSKHKSSREKQKRPSSAGRVPAAAAAAQHNLDDLMVIHSIPLQQRNLGLLDRNQDPEERQGHRSGSSTLPSGRPGPRRALEQSSASLSRPPPSARRRNPPPRTLLPLVPSPGQAGSIAEVIRGTRLPTANERLSRSRNTLLPPICGSGAGDPDGPQPSKPAQQRQKGPSWTQSALNQEAGAPRERQHPPDACSRPNTTHTYRSDTPYRRSFTVLDVSQGRPGRASVATDALGIGVTGVSLGISSSSFLDAVSHQPLGHGLFRDGEEPRPQVSGPAPVGPTSTPVPLRSHVRGGASSRASRTGP